MLFKLVDAWQKTEALRIDSESDEMHLSMSNNSLYSKPVDDIKMANDLSLESFVRSLRLSDHPLLTSKSSLRAGYYAILEYLVLACAPETRYIKARLEQYRHSLVDGNEPVKLTEESKNVVVRNVLKKPWKSKYRFWLFCDLALILEDEELITEARLKLLAFLGLRSERMINNLNETLFNDKPIPMAFYFANNSIMQFRVNRRFAEKIENRFMVAANIGAGKSTLLNALAGKEALRTSQAACTVNLCYLYNKPFEDRFVHLFGSELKLGADYDDLITGENTDVSYIATYFRSLVKPQKRVCLIDTPGINPATNSEHGELTKRAIAEESYDKLIYVFNANRLGTDEEFRLLKFVSENVPKEKMIFVINKLDEFNKTEDSIEASLGGVRKVLANLGYENPIICPVSAYFALLAKMRKNGELLTEEQTDKFDYFVKKFSKPEYDLSRFYGQTSNNITSNGQTSDSFAAMTAKCGLDGLENVLYGQYLTKTGIKFNSNFTRYW
jgi:signal recognition particle receptor subunit beta